jgi:hypothetical protein
MSKDIQLQFQVRTASVDEVSGETRVVVGQAATETIEIYRLPEITWDVATWAHDGLRLRWSTDYNVGSTEMLLTALGARSTESEPISRLLRNSRYISASYYDSTAVIPFDQLLTWPDDHDELFLSYNYGTDVIGPFWPGSASTTIEYDAGTVSVEPTLEWHGVVLLAYVRDYGETHQWVRTSDGNLYELSESEIYTAPSGYVVFEVDYPMGKAFQLFTSSSNASGSVWGTDVTDMQAIKKYFHKFVWTDDYGNKRHSYLECFLPGQENFQVTKNAVYQADVLDERLYETVSNATTVKTHLTISGVITYDSTTTDPEEFRWIVNHHVRWYSPLHGNYADLYISDVTLTERQNRCEIQISAIKETV